MEYRAIDIETHEEKDISKFGPGSHRHYLEGEDSYILDIAIAGPDHVEYHKASPEFFARLREIQDDYIWIMHNGFYDMSWLMYEGFRPKKCIDTIGLVKMLDENRMHYSLDSCARDYLGKGKHEEEIAAYCREKGWRGKPQKHLRKIPFEIRKRYGAEDARLTYDLYDNLIPMIKDQELNYIWDIECRLLPLLYETHHRGLRIDEDRREATSEELGKEIQDLESWLFEKAGGPFLEGSGKQLKEVFDRLNLPYQVNPPTAKMLEKDPLANGNPSFKAENLLPYGVEPDMEYFPHVLVSYRKLKKLKRDFIDRLDDFMVQGRIHPMVNPYGTVTGRPTCTTPNIFQIPKRGRGKKICRTLFLPEEGEEWVSSDVASEEFRMFAHYASGPGSDRIRERYNTISGYDMHKENAKIGGCDRTKAKTIGLGTLFGMGKKKMATNLGVGEKQGESIVKRFHVANPSFGHTAKRAQRWAEQKGYMRTLSKRRRRFHRGEGAYKALNFLTQGNSADFAKIILVKLYESGVLEHITFLLWLYDEFNFSAAPDKRHLLKALYDLANTALPLRVKMELGLEVGSNWGNIQEIGWDSVLTNY